MQFSLTGSGSLGLGGLFGVFFFRSKKARLADGHQSNIDAVARNIAQLIRCG